MAIGERKGTKSYEVKSYIESNLDFDWKSSDSDKKLQEIFPRDDKKYLKKCLNNYLREYQGDINIKKFSYEEILEVRKMIKWWQKYASDPWKELIPQRDEMRSKTYKLSVPITDEISKIAAEFGLTATDIINHSLKRFIMEYEANKQRQLNKI